jgi:hypothetical protein
VAGNYGKLVKKAMHKRGESSSIADAVYQQLAEDFPRRWIEWVRSAKWEGPIDVPLESIDFVHRKTWTAKPDDKKVKRFKGDIKSDAVKPAVLVNEPDNNKMIIADGHHRALAAQELGVPVKAYVASVSLVRGDWDLMHSHQKRRDGEGAKP